MKTPLLTLVACTILISGCGWFSDDPVIPVGEDDEEMNAAIEKARSTVAVFIKRFENPKPTDEGFSVKKLVTDGDTTEHFWLSGLTYSNATFTGTIANNAQWVGNIKFGQQVSVAETNITDWMYMENRKIVGNYTLRVLLNRMPKKRAAEIRKHLKAEDNQE